MTTSLAMTDKFLDLLTKNCYAAVNAGNRALADKTCPKVDDAKNACAKPIDASDYLGVTYDISDGYNSQGFRAGVGNLGFQIPDFSKLNPESQIGIITDPRFSKPIPDLRFYESNHNSNPRSQI